MERCTASLLVPGVRLVANAERPALLGHPSPHRPSEHILRFVLERPLGESVGLPKSHRRPRGGDGDAVRHTPPVIPAKSEQEGRSRS